MDFDQGLVAPGCIVERRFELGRREVAKVAVQAAGVVPVDPAEGGKFDVFDGLPRPAAGRPVDQLGFVVSVDRLGEGAIEAVPDGADGWDAADLSEALSVANRGELPCDPASE